MNFNWYRLFDLTAFLDTKLVSRSMSFQIPELGIKRILITNGINPSILIDDTFMRLNSDKNPLIKSPYAVFVDNANWVWLGVEV